MAHAIQLAQRGLNTTSPNPRVGCVLVKNDVILGEGWHVKAGEGHAEVNAIAHAKQLGNELSGATAYVTLEPCSHTGRTAPCADALIAAGIGMLVTAMQDPNPLVSGRGNQRLQDAGITVITGICEADAQVLNSGFIKRMQTGLPLVRVKMASSLDGKTAMASGESQWITSEAAREDVQQWRARACAIVTGINTVLADDPLLNVRLENTSRQPQRVILDSELRCPKTAAILSDNNTIILHCTDDATAHKQLASAGATLVKLPRDSITQRIDLTAVVKWLGEQQFNEVHVEAGATLAGNFINQGLADELVLYLAPCLMGGEAKSLVSLSGVDTMAQRIHLDIQDIRAIGVDWRVIARPVRT